MKNENGVIAIYSRKSKYTGKGESIGNQVELCREYIRLHYGDAEAEKAIVFEDEGFSGGGDLPGAESGCDPCDRLQLHGAGAFRPCVHVPGG